MWKNGQQSEESGREGLGDTNWREASGYRIETRVYGVAENRLLQKALARMLTAKKSEIAVAGMNGTLPFSTRRKYRRSANLLLPEWSFDTRL